MTLPQGCVDCHLSFLDYLSLLHKTLELKNLCDHAMMVQKEDHCY